MSQPSETVLDWLASNLGGRALAPLTGTDTRALRAAVQILEHWAYDRDVQVLEAFNLIVLRMQPKCRELAYHAIAMVLDWSDRKKIWRTCSLLPIERPLVCSFEPGGSRRDLSEKTERSQP